MSTLRNGIEPSAAAFQVAASSGDASGTQETAQMLYVGFLYIECPFRGPSGLLVSDYSPLPLRTRVPERESCSRERCNDLARPAVSKGSLGRSSSSDRLRVTIQVRASYRKRRAVHSANQVLWPAGGYHLHALHFVRERARCRSMDVLQDTRRLAVVGSSNLPYTRGFPGSSSSAEAPHALASSGARLRSLSGCSPESMGVGRRRGGICTRLLWRKLRLQYIPDCIQSEGGVLFDLFRRKR